MLRQIADTVVQVISANPTPSDVYLTFAAAIPGRYWAFILPTDRPGAGDVDISLMPASACQDRRFYAGNCQVHGSKPRHCRTSRVSQERRSLLATGLCFRDDIARMCVFCTRASAHVCVCVCGCVCVCLCVCVCACVRVLFFAVLGSLLTQAEVVQT